MGESSRIYYPVCRAILEVVFDGFGPTARDTPPQIIPILPRRATVHKNSYSQADSWSVEFDGLDLPIDPELIRAGAISIYLFQIPSTDEGARVVSRQTNALDASSGQRSRPGSPRSGFASALERSRAAVVDFIALSQKRADAIRKYTYSAEPIIYGLFDETDLDRTSSGSSMRIQGQDYTDYLIKLQWPPTPNGRARPIPVGKRLDVQLTEILARADPSGRLRLELRGIEYIDAARTIPNLPIVGAKETRGKKRGIPVESDTSYWDVMSKLARRYGLIIFVDGLSVVLSKPKNFLAKDIDQIRAFAWGENLSSLRLSRKLAKQQVPQVVIQGYDDVTRRPFEVKYPTRTDKVPTGIGVKKDEFVRLPARGITDRAILQEMAEQYFFQTAHAERSVSFSTKDLTDMREDDLLNLAAGDAVSVQFDTDRFRQIMRNPGLTSEARIAWLVNRGYGEAIAAVIASHYQKLEALSRPLRIKEASYNYDANSGISIEVEAEDFIVVGGDRLATSAIARGVGAAT